MSNEPDGSVFNCYLREAQKGGATITIKDISGVEVASRTGTSQAGINRVLWNMRPGEDSGSDDHSGFRRREGPPPLVPGDYRITVEVADERATMIGTIRARIW